LTGIQEKESGAEGAYLKKKIVYRPSGGGTLGKEKSDLGRDLQHITRNRSCRPPELRQRGRPGRGLGNRNDGRKSSAGIETR